MTADPPVVMGPSPTEPRAVGRGSSRWRDPVWVFVGLLAVTCFFGLKSRFINPDSTFFYMRITSPLLDGDFDYTNDMERLSLEPMYRRNDYYPWPQGLPINPFPMGAPILHTPFFLAGEGLAALLRAAGWSPHGRWYLNLDGVQYKTLVLGNALLTATALYWLYLLLCRRFTAAAAAWTTLLCWLATPLPAYVYLLGNHSHAASVLTAVLVCGLWLATAERESPGHYALIGLAAGAGALVRWQDALVLVLVLLPLRRPARYGLCLAAAAAGFWAVFSLQCLEWHFTLGRILAAPQGGAFMRWTRSEFVNVLLSARAGLLTWHPVFVFALVGLARIPATLNDGARSREAADPGRSQPCSYGWRVAAGAALVVFQQVYACGAAADWWAGNSFGQRRLLGVLPFFALGLAAFYDASARRDPRTRHLAWAVGAALAAFNGLLFFQYCHQDVFLTGGVYDFRRIVADQFRVLAGAPRFVLPFLADNLWSQLQALQFAGRLAVLGCWAAMLVFGMLAARQLARWAGLAPRSEPPAPLAATAV